jgi:hypothetical protein
MAQAQVHARPTVAAEEVATPAVAEAPAADLTGGIGNSAVADVVRAKNTPTGPRKLDPSKTGIVHFGMNEGARAEAQALNAANKDDGGALSIRNQGTEHQFKDGKITYDLSSPVAAAEYTSTLGLPDEQAVAAAEFLGRPDLDGRAKDELANLVKTLSQAEMGERELTRLVLSGHSTGNEFWGDDNGVITMDDFAKLAEIFPNASGAIEHLMLSACSSGGERQHEKYREMFGGLKSSSAYLGSSPGTHSGALGHLKSWEAHTEKGDAVSAIDPAMVEGQRKAENLSTWNAEDGYQATDKGSFDDDLTQAYYFGENQPGFESGEANLNDRAQHATLREQYDRLRRIEQSGQADEQWQTWAKEQADHTIRLLHYEDAVRGRFTEANRPALEEGYALFGREMPAFEKLSRKDALAEIASLKAEMGTAEPDYESMSDEDLARWQVIWKLDDGLVRMTNEAVPSNWL